MRQRLQALFAIECVAIEVLILIFRFDAAAYHQAMYVLIEAIGIVRHGNTQFPALAIGKEPADNMIADFFRSCGYDVVATHGLKSVGPTAVARFTREQIMQGFEDTNTPDAEALIHVGTNLPVSSMTPEIEKKFGKPLIGVNVATYWLAMRRLGIDDKLPGMGLLAEMH